MEGIIILVIAQMLLGYVLMHLEEDSDKDFDGYFEDDEFLRDTDGGDGNNGGNGSGSGDERSSGGDSEDREEQQ